MPTEAEIEAGAREILRQRGKQWVNDDASWRVEMRLYKSGAGIRAACLADAMNDARAALTAAEEARGQVSGVLSDERILFLERLAKHIPDDPMPIATKQFLNLLSLARRGAGQAVPEGWALVPKKPTEAMAIAGECAPTWFNGMPAHFRNVWDAMIAASPKPEDKP